MPRRFIPFSLVAFLSAGTVMAAVWDYDCERAIKHLKNAQEGVASSHSEWESAKSELESAKSFYRICTPSRYADCEFERSQVNYAIDRYNLALSELQSKIGDFNSFVRRFQNSCLR